MRARFGLLLMLAPAGALARPAPLALLPGATPGEWRPAPWAGELDQEVQRVRQRFKGTVALYTSDPVRRVRHGLDAEKPSYLASGVKIMFMLEAFRQREAGQLSFDEELAYGADDIRDGAPVVNPKPLGTKLKLRDLLTWMMQSSDNAASDMVAKRVGLANINRGLEELGFRGVSPLSRLIDVRRGVFREMDVRADDLTPVDIRTIRWTPIWEPQVAKLTELLGRPKGSLTKQDMLDAFDRFYAAGVNCARLDTVGAILERMLAGELLNPQASAEMIALMSESKTSAHRILGRLPSGTKAAHKTGSQYERICDLGIVYLPDGPFVFTACLAGGNDRVGAEDALARVARKAYDVVAQDRQKAKLAAGKP